jgi:hypothetical protein
MIPTKLPEHSDLMAPRRHMLPSHDGQSMLPNRPIHSGAVRYSCDVSSKT